MKKDKVTHIKMRDADADRERIVHTDMREDRFPESDMNKAQPADENKVKDENKLSEEEEERRRKKNADIGALAKEVRGTVSSRGTSRSSDDIAGVSDLDNRLKR